jgi:hypothetical protein
MPADVQRFAGVAPATDAIEAFDTRREPETLTVRSASSDPYALWLAQREAQQETERPEIRWVYRHERVTRPASAFEEIGS